MLKRKKHCFVCSENFITSQIGAKFCSPECRRIAKQQRQAETKEKKVSRKIAKLPVNDAWRWVAKECKRAGTVEVLQGVDLEKLLAIYTYRYKCYGYDSKKGVSRFHICHIYPVNGDKRVGLLHHLNLFVGDHLSNQKHGAKDYGEGLYIDRDSLQNKWVVSGDHTEREVLTLIESYLGDKLKCYLLGNPVRKSVRFTLIDRILKYETGRDRGELEKLSTAALREIDANRRGKIGYSVSIAPKRTLTVYCDELTRLIDELDDCQWRDHLIVCLDGVRVLASYLAMREGFLYSSPFSEILVKVDHVSFTPFVLREGKDDSKLRDFIRITCFETLSGKCLEIEQFRNTLKSYLCFNQSIPLIHSKRACWTEEWNIFFDKQLPSLLSSCESLGIVSEELDWLKASA